ncbi:MAG: M3 family oligoendopeptidase [Bacteroidales bacterium]|nr:M3 family oligoendopeptidase [Bacteroidales bacterium]
MNLTHPLSKVKAKRKFVSTDLSIRSFKDIQEYFEDLLLREFNSGNDVKLWLLDRSELASILEENLAWRYIKMNCNTADEKLAKSYGLFITQIEPEVARFSNLLDEKFFNSPLKSELDNKEFLVFNRSLKTRMDIFREKNLSLISELQVEEQEYGKVSSEMTIPHGGKEITLQEAANFTKDPDRSIRKDFFERINKRRLKDANTLQNLLTSLIAKRNTLAQNADFDDYLEYKWADLGRFDYSFEENMQFHEAIALEVCPIVDAIMLERKKSLGVNTLRPWDLEVDPELKPALKPFSFVDELVSKTIVSFGKIRSKYGSYIREMKEGEFFDLDSRIGKAPGGFNYPLYESNIPFIYMNATGNLRDLETMFHEGGHAIHSFLSAGQKFLDYKELPAEVAELASMSMELISMDQWYHFFDFEEDLKRAKKTQLEGVLQVLPWIAAVDKFQHWLYKNPVHSHQERNNTWLEIMDVFGSKIVDWKGFSKEREYMWQKQLHIFEVPLYYVEYGIAQLGAIAIWKEYRRNPEKALDQFEAALSLGYSVPIPEIYKTAGISFDFSQDYVRELMDFVSEELSNLN